MYDETLKGNTDYINQVFDLNNQDFASVLNKNKEDIIKCNYYNLILFNKTLL